MCRQIGCTRPRICCSYLKSGQQEIKRSNSPRFPATGTVLTTHIVPANSPQLPACQRANEIQSPCDYGTGPQTNWSESTVQLSECMARMFKWKWKTESSGKLLSYLSWILCFKWNAKLCTASWLRWTRLDHTQSMVWLLRNTAARHSAKILQKSFSLWRHKAHFSERFSFCTSHFVVWQESWSRRFQCGRPVWEKKQISAENAQSLTNWTFAPFPGVTTSIEEIENQNFGPVGLAQRRHCHCLCTDQQAPALGRICISVGPRALQNADCNS